MLVLETALKKIADIINDGPLNYVSHQEVQPLTSNNFLHPTRKRIRQGLKPLDLSSISEATSKLVQGYARTLVL